MFFQRFYDDGLAQASYMIGCQQTGDALIVDPNRNIQQYIDAAAKEALRISHVTETHIHADFVSGSRELAHRTGAQLLLSDEGGDDWRYAYAADASAQLLKDNDRFQVGNIRVDVLHTPGHTPEHLSFLITDLPAASGPWGIITGDFVFVGDVGRPDLLERAVGQEGTMEDAARTLYRSLQRFRELPDHLQVWPGHGAGSACGKSLGAVPSTTVGYEKIGNWGVASTNEAEFVSMVLAGQPEPPTYFAQMKRINKEGPRIIGSVELPPKLEPGRIDALLDADAVIVDTRRARDFAAGHIPRTISIPLTSSFTTWAGWLLPYDRDVYLIVDDRSAHAAKNALRELSMIGLDRVAGFFEASAIQSWREKGGQLQTITQMSPAQLAEMMNRDAVTVIDVRGRSEWSAGHLPGVPNIPLGHLLQQLEDVPTDKPIVLHCQGGGRSNIGAGLLQARGIENVINLEGGFTQWDKEGRPVEHGENPAPAGL